MGQAIGQSLPMAVGIALSPVAIVAVVIMLTTPQAARNGPAFLPGWLAGLAVAGAIAQTAIAGGQQAIAYLVFAIVATAGVAVPVAIYVAMRKRSAEVLAKLKDWMSRENAVILSVLCLLIAAKLIGGAIGALTG